MTKSERGGAAESGSSTPARSVSACPNCHSSDSTKINSYKHCWISCDYCGVVRRERKDRYAFNGRILQAIIRGTRLRSVFERTLLSVDDVIQDETRWYDYYHDAAQRGIAGTKWEAVNASVFANLARYDISVSGKAILDISGGPGFLTKELQRITSRAVVTEFSQFAIDGMTKALGIEGAKFDYNCDEIHKCVSGKFDVVFIISSIGFCDDLRAFVGSLQNVLTKNAIVYLAHSTPTLGMMIRWQFDEYTLRRSWPADIVAKYFAEIGMHEAARVYDGIYRYDENWFFEPRGLLRRALVGVHRVLGNWYLRRALNRKNNINRELVVKNVLQIFRLP